MCAPILEETSTGCTGTWTVSQMYFQLDGYQPQLKWTESFWDDNALAKIVAGPLSPLKQKSPSGNIELVLGLKPSGASHLLISSDDAREIASANRLPYPHPSSAYSAYHFESLSPIIFKNHEQLSHKLRSLKQKNRKAPSQANRNYHDGSPDLYRAAFEHGRVFYQVLNNMVDHRKYGVDDTSWIQQTRVLSFVFNVRGLDFRTSEQKKLNPDVLDFGFCEAILPDLTPNFSTARHIMNPKNMMLGKKQPKMPFSHGTSEDTTSKDLPQRIQAVFKDYQGPKSRNPMIILVCKKEESLNLLCDMGVDTSGWESGIKDLLLPDLGPRVNSSPRGQRGPSHSRQPSLSSNSYPPTRQSTRIRSRSRSPDHIRDADRRHGSASASSSSRDHKDFESCTSTRQSYAPVYVLDVRELYVKLMQATNVGGVADIARFFKLTDEAGWCAGNESATIINIWKEMVSSLPIDEQREFRKAVLDPTSSLQVSASDSTPAAEPKPYVYDSDDDRDPNEIIAQPQKGNVMENIGKTDDPYGFDESDNSEDD